MSDRYLVGEAPLNRGVVIADGHPVTRMGLRELLDDAGVRVVSECGNGEEALRLAREAHPDLVILALDLASEMDGIRACWDLKDLPEPPRVLVLSAHDLPVDVASCLLGSADGYLHKRAGRQEFLEAVRRVSSGERVWRSDGQVVVPDNEIRLSPKEREILVLMVLGHTDSEMSRTLSIGPETVKTHTRNILKKLSAKCRKDICKNPP